jgi:uncharacterized protein YidB (DUF937 family)
MALLDAIHGHLGQSQIDQISQQLGIDPSMAQTAIAAAVPMIMAGMAKHATQQAQTAQQQAQRNQPHLGGLLGQIFGSR